MLVVRGPASRVQLVWRAEDERLLQRLEDEELVSRFFSFLVGVFGSRTHTPVVGLHPRAGGLIAEVRKLPGGADAVSAALGGKLATLARFLDALEMKASPPELLHHLAVFRAKLAGALEVVAPERAAIAWGRALAAWLVLSEERTYLGRLEASVLGNVELGGRAGAGGRLAERAPLELVADVAGRADACARELGAAGRSALIALAATDDAARLAGASPEASRAVRSLAERRRNAAIETALAVIADGLDEASLRGELASAGPGILLRALGVWTWASNDEAVEHFVIERIERIGWDLYRASQWDALRALVEPFRPIFESLAARIERDPSQLAYAAGCAQMFVFLAEVDRSLGGRVELAERAVRTCPSHRNGRIVLAAALCAQAREAMRGMIVLARRGEVERIEALLARAGTLWPDTTGLPEATEALAQLKRKVLLV